VNCRANEEKVFTSTKVSGVLERSFIEARLHTDGGQRESIVPLQARLAESVAIPFYVVLDPESGRPVGETLVGLTTEGTFRSFLLEAVDAREEVSRLEAGR
jgi:hypothetical protein